MLKSGIYDLLLNRKLEALLAELDPRSHAQILKVPEEEIPIRLTQYLKDIIFQQLQRLEGSDLESLDYLERVNALIRLSALEEGELCDSEFSHSSLRQLRSLIQPNEPRWFGQKEIAHPESPIAYSSLFTGSRGEPPLYTELRREIRTADRVDFLVSFIKWSGLRLIMDDLEKFTQDGGQLRVITTPYMGATDQGAVEKLSRLRNTEVRVTYDTAFTRLHAKTYIFGRDNGFSTAYIGSSNVSQAALSSGLEWNMKLAEKDQGWIMEKIRATFAAYWISDQFEKYGEASRERFAAAIEAEKHQGSQATGTFFDLRPFPFQQEMLESLEAERRIHGHYRNLVVAATGTGKTMIAAFDFKRFREEHPTARLLFVAHREEILRQSLASFRAVLKDNDFGELYVGQHKPRDRKNLFLSIQTFRFAALEGTLAPDFYDFIVVDEFHHAAAISYQLLLNHFTPRILLGLTATPERMDGKSILDYFHGRIAAEMRLPEAIQRKLLVPFHYFGVADTADLSGLSWSRGGYQAADLNQVFVFSRAAAQKRVRQIIQAMTYYLTDLESSKALGFCVSQEHAAFMAETFNAGGIPSLALTSASAREERAAAQARLVAGEIKVIFVVDLYNEGVDIPEVNTVLFLRPTESLTVFLQQLGRGLRMAPGKECLTVLDFIGRQHSRYRFEDKFRALLVQRDVSLKKEISQDFPNLPLGCYIKLEKTPRQIILDTISRVTGQRAYLIDLIAQYHDLVQRDFEVDEFLDYWHNQGRPLGLQDIYRFKTSFAGLKNLAQVIPEPAQPFPWEAQWLRFLPRLASCNSRRWLKLLLDALEDPLRDDTLEEVRLLQMFQISFWNDLQGRDSLSACQKTLQGLAAHPLVYREFRAVLNHLLDTIRFVDEGVDIGCANPLDLHCRYSRDQLLVGLGQRDPGAMREGVKFLKDIQTDVLLITLRKNEKHYSPSTMYKDYSINESLFHWQSQSTTSEQSPTGQRYINQRKNGHHILLFVRESKTDLLGTAPYTFLGEADYVSHEGSKPMSITWRLRKPIPASFIEVSNTLGIV